MIEYSNTKHRICFFLNLSKTDCSHDYHYNQYNYYADFSRGWKFGPQCVLMQHFWGVLTRPAWANSNCTAVLQAPLQLDGQTWLRTSVTGDSSRGVIPFWPNASLMSCSIVCWEKQKPFKVCLCDSVDATKSRLSLSLVHLSVVVITQNTANLKHNYEGMLICGCLSQSTSIPSSVSSFQQLTRWRTLPSESGSRSAQG